MHTRHEREREHQVEFSKAEQLVQRLHWKAASLRCSYARAFGSTKEVHDELGMNSTADAKFVRKMFQIDFFEFYVLLERCIISALTLLDVQISKFARNEETTRPLIFGTSPSVNNFFSNHRFHANLLVALNHPDCPLYELLGTGETRRYLSLAKDFRNRWKVLQNSDDSEDNKKEIMAIEFLDLPSMLVHLNKALDSALDLVATRALIAEHRSGLSAGDSSPGLRGGDDPFVGSPKPDDIPWEAVQDEMEWEAS